MRRRFNALWYVALAAPLLLVAARCIEDEQLYRDAEGDWHLVGEIQNETDVQGTDMLLAGTLYDSEGNVLARGQGGLCPHELSPRSFSTFDIEFPNSSGVPNPARHSVQAISGRALPGALPILDADFRNLATDRQGTNINIRGTIRVGASYPGNFSGCAAFYDISGKVVRAVPILGFGGLEIDIDQPFDVTLREIPLTAETVRLWLMGPGDELLTSDYQAVTSVVIKID